MKMMDLNSKSEKELYDIIYISHTELNIQINNDLSKEDRPCIIVKIDKKRKIYYLLILTSKRNNERKQIKLEDGRSYINIQKPIPISKNIIDYADLADFYINEAIIRKIKSYIN